MVGALGLALLYYTFWHTTGKVPHLSESIGFLVEDQPPEEIHDVESGRSHSDRPGMSATRPVKTEMDFASVTATTMFDTFLLLLIGIGPKLALVPFLNATAGMPLATKRLVLGGLLTRLLHLPTGTLSVLSGIILLIAIWMVFGRDNPAESSHSRGRCIPDRTTPAADSRNDLRIGMK